MQPITATEQHGSSSNSGNSRESAEWRASLKAFVDGRLRTDSYKAALAKLRQQRLKRSPQFLAEHALRPEVVFPLNLQHLIDGIVTSVADDGGRVAMESADFFVVNVRATWSFFEQRVQQQVLAAQNEEDQQKEHAANNNKDRRDEEDRLHASKEDAARHKHRYEIHALLQDVLISWYLVDALTKVCSQLRSTNPLLGEVWRFLNKQLPVLMIHCMPQFHGSYLHSQLPEVRNAMMDLGGCFRDLMQSWYMASTGAISKPGGGGSGVVEASTLRQCEEHIRHRMRQLRGVHFSASTATPNPFSVASPTIDKATATLNSSQQTAGGAAAASTVSSSAPSTLRGKLAVDAFIRGAFELSLRHPFACEHCGATLPDAAAREKHRHTHYATQGSRDDIAVRLPFPSASDFLAHVPFDFAAAAARPKSSAAAEITDDGLPFEETHYFPKWFGRTSDAKRLHGTVQVRRTSSLQGGGDDASHRKRQRGDDSHFHASSGASASATANSVVVADVGSRYTCMACGGVMTPVQDPITHRWMLERAVLCDARRGITSGVMHEGCS